MYIEAPHIKKLLDSPDACVVPVSVTRAFEEHLNSFPWTFSGSHLDWTKSAGGRSINWNEYTDEGFVRWARSTTIGNHSHIVIVYCGNEPGLLLSFDFGITHLDTAVWGAPGCRFAFGADKSDGLWRYAFSDFLEFDGVQTISAFFDSNAGI